MPPPYIQHTIFLEGGLREVITTYKNGNQTRVTYNANNRQIKVAHTDGTIYENVYDQNDVLIESTKTINQQKIKPSFDGEIMIC
jgi:YD repeat-containing protein